MELIQHVADALRLVRAMKISINSKLLQQVENIDRPENRPKRNWCNPRK